MPWRSHHEFFWVGCQCPEFLFCFVVAFHQLQDSCRNSPWLHTSLIVGKSVTLFHLSSLSTPKSAHSIFFHTSLKDLFLIYIDFAHDCWCRLLRFPPFFLPSSSRRSFRSAVSGRHPCKHRRASPTLHQKHVLSHLSAKCRLFPSQLFPKSFSSLFLSGASGLTCFTTTTCVVV